MSKPKTYRLIYADPPWRYRDTSKQRGGAARHYPTASNLEIAAHIELLADPSGCALACWHTDPTDDDACRMFVAAGWKLRKRNFLVWVKTTSAGFVDVLGNGLAWGMGSYTRANVECVHLWTRGKDWPRVVIHDVHQVVVAPRLEHSAKPPEARRRIERLFGPMNRLEMYARRRSVGWRAWGNEV